MSNCSSRWLARSSGAHYAQLVYDRLLSAGVRRLLARGGACVRIDYCGLPRDKLARRDRLQVEFEEGSLDKEVSGAWTPPLFRLIASRYSRSRVIEDVYEQSRYQRDRAGGYSTTLLRSL